MINEKRSHHCGVLTKEQAGEQVVLCGWVAKRRDHGGLIFIDLRDRSGIVQVVADPESAGSSFKTAEDIRNEYVIKVIGNVRLRDEDTINENIPTGTIEVLAHDIEVLNGAKTPPFYIKDGIDTDENLRLKYRYLDLRRPEMQRNLILRHKVAKLMRDYLDDNHFLEIETPMLCKSTPEGARDYLVPSRVNPGKFYALPQSPQIFKQLLMVAGMERYFQIARCFRDEDLRADRQPEFTQLDMEMSFMEVDEILELMEGLIHHIFKGALGKDIQIPFQRLTWDDAMDRFGSDKPDLRFGMELKNVSEAVQGCTFQVFNNVIANGGQVKCINVKGYADIPRRQLDELVKFCGIYGAKGMAWLQFPAEGGVKSSIAKFFSDENIEAIKKAAEVEAGDLLLFVADKPSVVAASLGALRIEMAKRRGLIDPDKLAFTWVVDFPMFEYNEEEKRYVAMHHPFTAPRDEDLPLLLTNPGKVYAKAYDMVLNGTEIGGGSIRIHRRDVQERVFKVMGFSQEEAQARFGFLLDAFKYGAPPHGGLALGWDRIAGMLTGSPSIRDVIAFPKAGDGLDPLTGAPAPITDEQRKETGVDYVPEDDEDAEDAEEAEDSEKTL